MTLYRKKWLFHLLLIILLLIVLGVAYWDEREETIEDDSIEKLLPHAPKNLNLSAVENINQRIAGRNQFSFIVLGDNRYNFKKFEHILQEALSHKPDFIIHTGDFTSSGKYQQYLKVIDIINKCPVPMVFIPGNHDITHHGAQCFAHIFGPLNFYFDAGRYRFICINNNEEEVAPDFINLSPKEHINESYDYEPGMDVGQIGALDKLLQEKKQNFIIMHIPPPPPGIPLQRTFTRNRTQFLELLHTYAPYIKRVFCGHIHGYGEFELDGIPYIITAGAGAKLYSSWGNFVGKFNYVLVSVEEDSVTHKVYFPG